ncbi:DUF3772 domain-containing protein [uncultured Roseovarius sp.]|uniref:DUF3772 domain-containing protein n=1 Tax=uncultured Roseovarius sp. TaxID=293344 RepID=UPI00261FFF5C|nr:DUF3772 domain-containing protein [uncultured Roseovarius sp.]
MTYLRTLIVVTLLAVCASGFSNVIPAAAQTETTTPDPEEWLKTATRADNAIESGRASSAVLEELRDELAGWRQQFQDAQNVNSNAISTVKGQLDALGPAPESGTEAEDIAALRSTLEKRLSELEVPVKTAETAYRRADGLIKGVDKIIRDRQKNELLELGPSPLNVKNWPAGAESIFSAWRTVEFEFMTAWGNPSKRSETVEQLPKLIIFMAIGTALIIRGRRWCNRLVRRILTPNARAGRWLIAFVISIGEFLLPYIGAIMFGIAAYSSGLFGLRGEAVFGGLIGSLFIYFLARWLAVRIFPFTENRPLMLPLEAEKRRSGRRLGTGLGLAMGLINFLDEMADVFDWSEAASIVIVFPVMILAAILLWRLARLMKVQTDTGGAAETEGFRNRITRLLSRAILVLAVVAPTLAAIGYFNAAEALMLPALLSLQLIAVLVLLQRLVSEVYVLLSGNSEGASESLTPVIAGLVLILLSVPLFALIWGARIADLTELWTQFTDGIYLGGIRISPTIFLTLAAIFAAGYLVTRFIQGTLKNTVLPKTKMDVGGQNAIVSGVGYVGIFLSALIAITSAGIDLSSLAIVAGALSVGIGFGLQTIVSNFVSGIILLIERPISEGDWIEVGGQHGYVRDISVRSTRIETFDRTDVIVPNSDLISGTVTNYTRGNTVGRVIVPVGVAYGSDTRHVEKILMSVAEAHPMVLANPAPAVVFKGFGADSLDFEIRAILRDVNWVLSVHSDMNHEIAQKFAEQKIEIPFAQRDVWFRNAEVLEKAVSPPKPKKPGTRRKAVKDHISEADMDGGGGDGE